MHVFIMALLMSCVNGEITTEGVGSLLKTYSYYINSSLALDKSDRQVMQTWFTNFQVQQVNITTFYRLDMLRHKERNFDWNNVSSEWQECITFHRQEIDNSEAGYYEMEGKCLNAVNAQESKKSSVHQVEKEIKKWRKSYKYLTNQCKASYPGDEDGAGQCLVEYMQRDNFLITFQRLILLKLECMSNLFNHIQASLQDFQTCLKRSLSRYLGAVRLTMAHLNQCYAIKNKKASQ